MSRLLSPPSETISKVSERASALAADQIAGAGTMAPAATPVTDFRKSRRFMGCSKRPGKTALETTSQGLCQTLTRAQRRIKYLISLMILYFSTGLRLHGALHTKKCLCLLWMQSFVGWVER